MKTNYKFALALILFSCVAEAASNKPGAPSRKIVQLRGRIIARRTRDSFEVVSFVQNQSLFLFRTDGATPKLVQIFYPHFGFSTLPSTIIAGSATAVLRVKRTASCDGTFASFKASAVDIPVNDEATKKSYDALPGLTWSGDALSLKPSTKIPCYTLIPVTSNGENSLSQPSAQPPNIASETHP